MPLRDIYNFICTHRDQNDRNAKFRERLFETITETWYLGLTSFGGPPVHFQIFHKKFVEVKRGREAWLDEQTYQELFAICQAFPGPASTKFLFATVLSRSGWICAITAFLFWSLPGALSMFALSLGVRQLSEKLPEPVYAFLSGLNASTVGIVAVAAVQLAEKCIKDPLSRILVIFGACAGLCYGALWYFPVLITIGGITTFVWDLWVGRRVRLWRQSWVDRRRRAADQAAVAENMTSLQLNRPDCSVEHDEVGDAIHARRSEQTNAPATEATVTQRKAPSSSANAPATFVSINNEQSRQGNLDELSARAKFAVSIRTGWIVLGLFVSSFVAVMVARSQLPSQGRIFSLFANMYLAGTIIFGGGPVVIPLLREYVVSPGWVQPRDFLIGLAIIQALPGPNFNFSVYLGALAVSSTRSVNSTVFAILGALIAYLGIFSPGLILTVAFQGFWSKLRVKPGFLALLRGINASAIGLVFTAVYRLWEVGYLTNTSTSDQGAGGRVSGRSLADEPWWVVVAVVTFAGNQWFDIPAPLGIAAGGVLGLGWWGAVRQ